MEFNNGITSIDIEGVNYPLYFHMIAVEEMARRTGENMSASPTKMFTDLIYSGMMNYAYVQELPFPKMSFVYELMQKFEDDERATEKRNELWAFFETSKWGAKWMEDLKEVKKKVDEAILEAQKLTGNT